MPVNGFAWSLEGHSLCFASPSQGHLFYSIPQTSNEGILSSRPWQDNLATQSPMSAAGPTSELEKALLRALPPDRCQTLSVTAEGSRVFFPSICNSCRTLQHQQLSQSVARLFPSSPPALRRVSIIAHFNVILKQIKC